MGLDNIPKQYPCKAQGTVVMTPRLNKDGVALTEDDGSTMMVIDCQATQACGGCPYVNELNKQDKEALGNPVYGMFGTDCWYRGKYGNYLLEAIGYGDSDDFSFYGDNEDGTEKSKGSCLTLAQVIDEAFDECDEEDGVYRMGGEDITADLKYASWYLKWAAEHADGLICWY
jgi:hypothetical protein